MPSSCRVLVVNERDPGHPRAGGAEVHIAAIFGRLARRGYEVTLATSSFRGARRHERLSDLEIRRLGPLVTYYPRLAYTVARETRRGRFDVVVECLNKVPFFTPLYSAVPVLAICHHLFGRVAFQQVSWPIAAGVTTLERLIPPVYRGLPFVAISESCRDDLIRRGIPAQTVRVSHCGVNTPTRTVDPDEPRPCRIAYVGRLEHYKRVDLMFRAAALLKERFPELEILVIGRGAAARRLERVAHELGLADRTRFLGFVSDAERDELLAETRVCVFPSPKEGWGMTVIEANAVGTPVVASDAPGLRDSVCHGETGYLVPTGDVAGFAERIGSLLADDALACAMAVRALEWSRHFDWERAADDMAAAVEDARKGL